MPTEQGKRIVNEVKSYLNKLEEIRKLAYQDPGAASAKLNRLEKSIERTLKELIGQDEADSFKNRPFLAYQMDEPVENVLIDVKDVQDYLIAGEEDWKLNSEAREASVHGHSGEMASIPLNERLIRQVYPEYEKKRAVFLVFRQDNPIVPIMKKFLIELGLQPFELSDMVPFLEEEKHDTNYNCLEAGFNNCQGYIILLTPDDEAKIRERWDSSSVDDRQEYHYQPRPNVLLEIGMAFALNAQGTVLIKIVSTQDEDKLFIPLPTDMDGMRYIPLGVKEGINGVDNADGLKRIAGKLLLAKCDMRSPSEDLLKLVVKELEDVIVLKEKRFRAKNNPDNCKGAEWRFIDTKAGMLQSLRFKVESSSNHWRAGFMIGASHPQSNQPLPVHAGSLLFHVGKTSGNYGITVWEGESRTCNDPLTLMSDGSISLSFEFDDKDGILFCKANGKDYLFQIPDSVWLNRVALLAWADGPDFVVDFRDIETNPQYEMLNILVVP